MARSDDKGKIIPFPGKNGEADSVMDTAAVWLTRLKEGLDAAQRAGLAAWLRQDPRHLEALRAMATFWGEQDLLLAVERLPDKRGLRRRLIACAALVLVSIGIGLTVYRADFSVMPPAVAVVQYEQTFATSLGERSTHNLPDGSVITLNTNTEVHVLYHARDRVVDLRQGEAHFVVAHNAERPFGVRAAGHIVQALGTAFNVRLQSVDKVEVMVTEGVVQILDDREPQADTAAQQAEQWWTRPALSSALVSGQLAVVDVRATAARPDVRELNADALEIKLAWQEGSLIFESEPLREVLAEFSRYNATEFVLEDAALAEVRIGGYIDAGDIDGLLRALEDNFQIEADRMSATRIVLRQQE